MSSEAQPSHSNLTFPILAGQGTGDNQIDGLPSYRRVIGGVDRTRAQTIQEIQKSRKIIGVVLGILSAVTLVVGVAVTATSGGPTNAFAFYSGLTAGVFSISLSILFLYKMYHARQQIRDLEGAQSTETFESADSIFQAMREREATLEERRAVLRLMNQQFYGEFVGTVCSQLSASPNSYELQILELIAGDPRFFAKENETQVVQFTHQETVLNNLSEVKRKEIIRDKMNTDVFTFYAESSENQTILKALAEDLKFLGLGVEQQMCLLEKIEQAATVATLVNQLPQDKYKELVQHIDPQTYPKSFDALVTSQNKSKFLALAPEWQRTLFEKASPESINELFSHLSSAEFKNHAQYVVGHKTQFAKTYAAVFEDDRIKNFEPALLKLFLEDEAFMIRQVGIVQGLEAGRYSSLVDHVVSGNDEHVLNLMIHSEHLKNLLPSQLYALLSKIDPNPVLNKIQNFDEFIEHLVQQEVPTPRLLQAVVGNPRVLTLLVSSPRIFLSLLEILEEPGLNSILNQIEENSINRLEQAISQTYEQEASQRVSQRLINYLFNSSIRINFSNEFKYRVINKSEESVAESLFALLNEEEFEGFVSCAQNDQGFSYGKLIATRPYAYAQWMANQDQIDTSKVIVVFKGMEPSQKTDFIRRCNEICAADAGKRSKISPTIKKCFEELAPLLKERLTGNNALLFTELANWPHLLAEKVVAQEALLNLEVMNHFWEKMDSEKQNYFKTGILSQLSIGQNALFPDVLIAQFIRIFQKNSALPSVMVEIFASKPEAFAHAVIQYPRHLSISIIQEKMSIPDKIAYFNKIKECNDSKLKLEDKIRVDLESILSIRDKEERSEKIKGSCLIHWFNQSTHEDFVTNVVNNSHLPEQDRHALALDFLEGMESEKVDLIIKNLDKFKIGQERYNKLLHILVKEAANCSAQGEFPESRATLCKKFAASVDNKKYQKGMRALPKEINPSNFQSFLLTF